MASGAETLNFVIEGLGIVSYKPTYTDNQTTYEATFMKFPGHLTQVSGDSTCYPC